MRNDTTKKDRPPSSDAGHDKMRRPSDLVAIWGEVETSRLRLRRPRLPADSAAMFAIHGDPATNLYNPFGADPDSASSEERLQQWIDQWKADGFGYWAALLPQSEEIVGFGGVRHFIWRDRDILNLYYRFTPSAWGQGYAAELAQTAVALARKHLPMWPVVARVRANNRPSIRTAERAGLSRRPDLDAEHLIFALGWAPLETPCTA
jgi:[ribosomal protein S5]-alanine N-acetyltransferase